MRKLNLGSGGIVVPGWESVDIGGDVDIKCDLRLGIPVPDNSIDYIWSEHFIEHITFFEAIKLFKDIYRALKQGGVVRTATPDLDHLITMYLTDWDNQEWLKNETYAFIKTRGMMFNWGMRDWEHKYTWNEEDLCAALRSVGFINVTVCRLKESQHDELTELENREESKLIVEGTKKKCIKISRLPR